MNLKVFKFIISPFFFCQVYITLTTLLLSWLQADDELNLFYSTPSIYVDTLHQANLTWEVKTDDFLPYADTPWAFWSGYFTSRIALKAYARKMNGLLQVMI